MTAAKAGPRGASTRRPKASRASAGKSGTRNGVGRPRIPFDGSDHDKVKLLAMAGTRQEIIAGLLGCDEKTLRSRFRAELDYGMEHAHAAVASTLLANALGGDIAAIIWYEKTRRGFRDISRHEHGGIDGAPIALRDMSGYTDEQLAVLEQAASLLAGSVAGEPEAPTA